MHMLSTVATLIVWQASPLACQTILYSDHELTRNTFTANIGLH
jgi:hypothetical protein